MNPLPYKSGVRGILMLHLQRRCRSAAAPGAAGQSPGIRPQRSQTLARPVPGRPGARQGLQAGKAAPLVAEVRVPRDWMRPMTEIEQFLDVISRAVVRHDACPALARLGMRDVGTTHAGPKWCFVRPDPRFALVIVTVSGRGSVWQGRRWHDVGPDTAYLMPMGAPHGYRVASRAPSLPAT